MVAFTEQFVGRNPSPNAAYALSKDRLALQSSAATKLAVDEQAMSAVFLITEKLADRVGDVIEPKGIRLANFTKNPIGFFNHQQWPLPIGVWRDPQGKLTIEIEDKRATGTLYFSRRSTEAEQVFALVAEGILTACSIGFNPLSDPIRRGDADPTPNSTYPGFYFPEIDLLEISVCGVPCLPTAGLLRSHLSRGKIAGRPISQAFRKSLEPLAEPDRAWSPGFGKGKTMNESSGESGGYTDQIQAIGEKHKEAMGDGHALHHHAENDAVHHEHPEGADEECLRGVKEDLEAVDGVKAVSQGPSKPDGEGWAKCWPKGVEPEPKPAGDEVQEGGKMAVTVRRCARCGTDHKDLVFSKLDHPVEKLTHWASCPKNGQPILLMIVPGKKKAADEALEDEVESMPPGAELAHQVCEAIETAQPKLEPERQKFWQKVDDTVREHGRKTYPDHDWGEEPKDDEESGDGEDAEDQEAEDIVDQYRSDKPLCAKMLRKALTARIVKRLSKKLKAVMGEAADHLEEMANLDPKAFGKAHKTASMSHCKGLRKCMKDDMGDDDGGDVEASMPAGSLDLKAVGEALKGLDGKLAEVGKQVYRVTGKKA